MYPEGRISKDEKLGRFHSGYELIDKDYDGIIIPYFIDGVSGSIFSKYKNGYKKNIFSRRKITLYFGKPVAKDIKADKLREIVQGLKR